MDVKPANDSVMYVNRQKYAKKAPYPDAQRSRIYYCMERVRVVAKTDSGYYKFDNGDYIRCDYLSITDNYLNIVQPKVASDIPSSTPQNTNKQNSCDPAAALKYAREHRDKDESLRRYIGDTKDGIMKAYAHNPRDNGEDEFVYYRNCTDGCGYPLKKIVVLCLYRGDDAANPADSAVSAASEDNAAPADSVP